MMLETGDSQRSAHLGSSSGGRLPRRVVFCTNFLPPYRLASLKMLTDAFQAFTVLVSTKMEEDRPWRADWSGLSVILQHSISIKTSTRHPHGFNERLVVHIPYDTTLLLRRLRPDVVISAELGVRSVLSALYCAVVPSCHLVIWADLSEISEKGRGSVRIWLRRWLIRHARAVVVNGASGRRYVEALGGPSERIHAVPYTTDVELFLQQPIVRQPAVRRRLLCVGQLIPRKGIFSFLAACTCWCEQHRSRTLEILIVGDGELWSVLESLQPPDNMSIRLEHATRYSDTPGVYQRAGVLVLPTLADTWALVVNEAMAAGLPILGSVYSQAVDEMVVDGVNGWRFRSDDAEDSYRALCRVMDCSDERLAAMGKCARETASAIRPEFVASLVTQVIESVCHGRAAI
jgi:glycosyltransferase involved in cell wall biosynthesis